MGKVLLIDPPSPGFFTSTEKYISMGSLYLSASLKKNGHEVVYFDINNIQTECKIRGSSFTQLEFYHSDVKPKLRQFSPQLIGISVHFSGRFSSSLEICNLIKGDFPYIPIVLGGIHPSIFAEDILKEYKCVDFILQGESDTTLVDLLHEIENNSNDFKRIDGIGFRENGTCIVNTKENFIENINTIPMPDYEIINIKDYYFDTSKWINPKGLSINTSIYILTSRSCPRQCVYCSMFLVHGPKYRMRSASAVLDEIAYLYEKYDHRYFSFMDDNFTLNKKRAIDICNGIVQKGMDIQFDTPNGLDLSTLNSEVIEALVKAGMVKTCLAVESGSQEIRNSINKKLPQQKIYEVFENIKKFPNLVYNVFFIIGFPNETQKTLDETYQLIKNLKLKKAVISFATPFPGTKLYNECMENDLIEINQKKLCNVENFYYANDEPFINPYAIDKNNLVEFRKKVYHELQIEN